MRERTTIEPYRIQKTPRAAWRRSRDEDPLFLVYPPLLGRLVRSRVRVSSSSYLVFRFSEFTSFFRIRSTFFGLEKRVFSTRTFSPANYFGWLVQVLLARVLRYVAVTVDITRIAPMRHAIGDHVLHKRRALDIGGLRRVGLPMTFRLRLGFYAMPHRF